MQRFQTAKVASATYWLGVNDFELNRTLGIGLLPYIWKSNKIRATGKLTWNGRHDQEYIWAKRISYF